MKYLTLSLILITTHAATLGQSHSLLPVDDFGTITFSEVIQAEATSKEDLFNNAYNYLQSLVDNHKELKKDPLVNEDRSEINLPLAFTVYRDFPVHSPHGIIKYNLTVSVKEGRYRYLATNFVFHYLERNRYGRFVEVKGKSKALEDPVYKGSQNLWDQHKQQTGEKVAVMVETLKAEMMFTPDEPEPKIVKVQVNDDW
ncbi:MAG: hypothetical protein DHS20C17_02940 [Cyclobacteriaceae bacterium]|nr:MAG: hypothetical protein DHS20C17_02940 [Cyclobacteriaceae bacterium]